MQSPAAAVFINLAVFAYPRFCPFAVSHNFKTVIPYIKKFIAVNVSLYEAMVVIGAGRY
jgi:hypothetical protein